MIALPALWVTVVLASAWRRRPPPARVASLLGDRPVLPRPRLSPVARRWATAAIAAATVGVVMPIAAPVAGIGAWAVPVVRARRRRGERATAVRRHLPETIDLLRLATGAGLNVPLAIDAVARRASGPVAVELAWVTDQMGGGRGCAEALDVAAGRLGDDGRPLLAALAASERYGAPLGESLARLAADARADRRRRAEEAARRVPVRLLFPLVLCVLPAFALLTLTPLIVGGIGSLQP